MNTLTEGSSSSPTFGAIFFRGNAASSCKNQESGLRGQESEQLGIKARICTRTLPTQLAATAPESGPTNSQSRNELLPNFSRCWVLRASKTSGGASLRQTDVEAKSVLWPDCGSPVASSVRRSQASPHPLLTYPKNKDALLNHIDHRRIRVRPASN